MPSYRGPRSTFNFLYLGKAQTADFKKCHLRCSFAQTRNKKSDFQRQKRLRGDWREKVGSEGSLSDVDTGSEFINYLAFLMKFFPAEGFLQSQQQGW